MGNPDSRLRVICVGHAALDRIFTVEAWPGGAKEQFIRIMPRRITGRRIWRTPETGAH